jgi:hypothetical protein
VVQLVLAVDAFTGVTAGDAGVKALAVFLSAAGALAVAACPVLHFPLLLVSGYLLRKRLLGRKTKRVTQQEYPNKSAPSQR